MFQHRFMLSIIAFGLLFSACSSDQQKGGSAMHDEALSNDLALITQSRIYFGHQSVGNNILDGLFDLAAAADAHGIGIQSLSDTIEFSEFYFIDAVIGENTKPETKCRSFARSLAGFGGHQPEIAFMKFCFVDFGRGMKAEEIFQLYASTIDSLKREYPSMTFMHVTAPLTAPGRGVKAFVKKLVGRGENYESDNAERGRFNHLVRRRFAGEPIFDLARIESTRPDGTRETFMHDGAPCEALVPAYTDDGGHLNKLGQERAARELIRVLAGALRARNKSAAVDLPKN